MTLLIQTVDSVMPIQLFGDQRHAQGHFRSGCLQTISLKMSPQACFHSERTMSKPILQSMLCQGTTFPYALTHNRARSRYLAKKIKKSSSALVLQLITKEGGAHQIHFKSVQRPNARNQRSASNPVLSRSHKHHLNENIHGHLQRRESDEGVPTSTLHCFQLKRQC